ncbi:hypothetical protein SAMN05421766_102211 [Zobellia uliginosa]|uniref:Uncharacterized protein n=1 Tax=Zobellia uliginosa TaxID=143224 RepID=A0ABY1KPD3_9FLAO|nr:hypothetical protein [Zobellia uliginosa]SIS48071.1 hypothetical protein SAMN05421766_102211 [Zobellia uliginosa]
MKIQVKEKTDYLSEDNWFEQIVNSLNNLNCELYVKGLTKLKQSEQKVKVQNLQNYILEHLKEYHSDFKWRTEFQVSEARDAIDIFGEKNNEILIIELDKWRADQVAKKLISRTAIMIDKKIGFISLCYAGTEKMNKNECLKFFRYGKTILSKLNNYYCGMIIE